MTQPTGQAAIDQIRRGILDEQLWKALYQIDDGLGVSSSTGSDLDEFVRAALMAYDEDRTSENKVAVHSAFERQLSGESARIRAALWS